MVGGQTSTSAFKSVTCRHKAWSGNSCSLRVACVVHVDRRNSSGILLWARVFTSGSRVLREPQFPCCEETDVQGEECDVHKGVASVRSGCTWDTTGLVTAWDILTTVTQVVHILTSGMGFSCTLKYVSADVYMRSKCLCSLYTPWKSSKYRRWSLRHNLLQPKGVTW